MSNKETVQTESGEVYTLVEPLGRGAIATAWEAEGPGGRRAAVKIAHSALHPDLRRQFETEYETLHDRILSRAEAWPAGRSLPPVPLFIYKAEPDALVLEWIEAPTLVAWIKEVTDLAVRQEQLVEPAYQYAWFLDFLHNRLGIGQSDRKLGDLHWDAGSNRLVVLDWNVVAGVDRAAEDVYKFGEFWYALLLEVPPIFDADLTANPGWEELSAAWRELLKACLHVNREARPTAKALLDSVIGLRDAYPLLPATLLSQGRELLAQFKGSREADRWVQLSKAHFQLDLAWRKGLAEAKAPTDEARQLLAGRGQAALAEVKQYLEVGRYTDAQAVLDQAEAELGDDLDGQLRVARWRCLYNAGQKSRKEKDSEGNDLSTSLRNMMVTDFSPLMQRLEKGEWIRIGGALDTALNALPRDSETRDILSSLRTETELHLALKDAKELKEEGNFAQAAAKYEEAQRLLPRIVYHSVLAQTLVSLDDAQAECKRRAQTEGRLVEILKELPQAIQDGRYGLAEKLYVEARPLTGGDPQAREELDGLFAPVPGLRDLRDSSQGGVAEEDLVRLAQNLLDRFLDYAVVQEEVGRTAIELLSRLERRAEAARYPDEVDGTLSFGRSLQQLLDSTGLSVSDPVEVSRCQSAVNNILAGKQHLQVELQRAVEGGDKQVLEAAAQRAFDAKVEAFREPDLSADRLRDTSVKEREIARIDSILTQFADRQTKLQELREEIEKLDREHKSLEQTIKDIEATVRSEKTGQLWRNLVNLRAQADEVNKLPNLEDLNRQLNQFYDLRQRGLVQIHLEQTVSALQRFDRDRASSSLSNLQEVLADAPSLATDYRYWIRFVQGELEQWERLEQSSPDALGFLGDYSKKETEKKLDPEEKKAVGTLFVQHPNSYAIQRLWQKLESDTGSGILSSAFGSVYDRERADIHKRLLKFLKAEQLDALEKDLADFDKQWREKLRDRPQEISHVEFVSSWVNRASQARALNASICDVDAFLTRSLSQNYLSVVVQIAHVESMTDNVCAEVLYVYRARWLECMEKLANYATTKSTMPMDRDFINKLLKAQKDTIEQKSRQGKRFFALLDGQREGQ